MDDLIYIQGCTMRNLFLFLFLISMADADFLNTKNANRCAYDLTPYQKHKGWCYVSRHNNQQYCSTTLKTKDFINGYEFVNGNCVLKNNLKITGLSQDDWDKSMALLAHATGFTLLFLIGFLSVLIAKK